MGCSPAFRALLKLVIKILMRFRFRVTNCQTILIDRTLHRVNWKNQKTDHTSDRELFENQYYQVEAKFNEILHPVVDPPPSKITT